MSQQTQLLDGGKNLILNKQGFQNGISSLQQIPLIAVSSKPSDLFNSQIIPGQPYQAFISNPNGIPKENYQHHTTYQGQRNYLFSSLSQQDSPSNSVRRQQQFGAVDSTIINNNSIIADSIKKQKLTQTASAVDLPRIPSPSSTLQQLQQQVSVQNNSLPLTHIGSQTRMPSFSPDRKNNNASKSHFHFSSSAAGLTLKLQMTQSRQSFNTRQLLPSQSHFNVSNLLQPTLDNMSSKNSIANLNNSSMQKYSFSSKFIRLSDNSTINKNNTSLSNADRTPKTTDSVVLRNSVVGSENTIKIFDKTKQNGKQSTAKINENQNSKVVIELSAEEKDQLQAIKSGGISSFVRAIQSNSEYIFRSEIERERIFIEKSLNQRKDEDNKQHFASQQFPQEHLEIDDGLFTETTENQNAQAASAVLEQNVRDLKKNNEKILCETIGSKRLSPNAQIQAVQSALLDTLRKCLQQINHEYLESYLVEVIQGLLFLSNKKHMVMESQKRDEMFSILQGITANEADWGIELFGNEESVQKFRFKMGEIALENAKLAAEIEKVRQESKAMSVQLEKEKKANQILSSHCQIAQNIQQKLAQKLEWKYESYVRRFNRENNIISKDEQSQISQKHLSHKRQSVLFAHSRNKSTNEKIMETQNTPKNHSTSRPSKISINCNNLSAPPKTDQKFQRLSHLLSPTRSTPSHFQENQGHLGLSFAEQIALLHEEDLNDTNQKHHQHHQHNKKNLSQLSQEVSSPSSISSQFGDVDKILMEASKITKIDNNEVVIKQIHEDIPVFFFNQETQTDSKITEWHLATGVSVQTDLNLVEKQFDHIMNNDRLEKLSKQEEIKEQLQNYLSDESDDSECQSSIHSLDSFESERGAENYRNKPGEEDETKNNLEIKGKIQEKTDSNNCNSEDDSRKKKIPAINPQKEIEKQFKKRISVVQILKGLPLGKRKKQLEKNDIDALADNIHVLQNFLQSSPSASDTSILIDPMEDPKQTATTIISPKTKFPPKQGILPAGKKPESNSSKGIKNTINNNKLTIPSNNNYKNIRASVQKIPSSELIPNSVKNNIVLGIPSSTKIGKHFGILRQSGKQGEPSLKAIPSSSFIEADKKTVNNLNDLNGKKSSKFFEQESKEELRSQILSIVKLYNLETEKSKNYEESIEQIFKIMQELFGFCYKIFTHIQRTQKDTYKSVVEQFFQTFTAIRWKLPSEIDQKLEEDLYPEEILQKKLAAKKKLLKKNLANPSKTPGGGFFLANLRGANKLTVQDKSVHPGIVLTKKLREAGLPKKFNGYLPLKAILRQITQIYEERARQVAENRLTPDTELCIFVFNRFLHQYGFKNVAEQKYLHFLMNVLNYQQIFRVQIFARAVGVLFMDDENYEIDEMDKFLSGWHFVTALSTLGQNVPYGEADMRIFCHYLRCYDYLRARMEKILHPPQIIDLRQFIEQSRESEQKTNNNNQNQANKNNLIDVDTFFARVLTEYRYVMNETKISVKNAFLACDLDGNGTININEFHTLFRHLEPDRFSLGKACKIFESSADIITADSKSLSFKRFTSMCLQDRLFSENSQRRFLGIYEKYEVDPLFVELKRTWTSEKQFISDSIDQLKPYVQPETFKQWKENLLVLNDRIQNNTNSNISALNSAQNNKNTGNNTQQQQGTLMKQISMDDNCNPTVMQLQSEYSSNVMPILIAHKMLKQELARLLDVTHTEEDLNFHDVDLDELENDDEYDKEYENDAANNNNIALEQQIQAQQQLALEQKQPSTYEQNQSNIIASNTKNVRLIIPNNLGDDEKSRNSSRSYNNNNNGNPSPPLNQNLQFLGFPPNISPSQKLLGLKQHLAEGNSLEIIDAQIYQFSDEQVVKETQPNAKKKTLALQKIQNAANSTGTAGLLPKKY